MTGLVEDNIIVEFQTTNYGAIIHDTNVQIWSPLFMLFSYYVFKKKLKSCILSLASMANKKINERTKPTMEDTTNFNLQTNKINFITNLKDIY